MICDIYIIFFEVDVILKDNIDVEVYKIFNIKEI